MPPETNPIPAGLRILVVDDNADAMFVLTMALRLKGFSVQSGDSGPQTLSIAEVWQPQAILLDISMPGMDGYATCRLLREQYWGRAMAVIALTGYGGMADQQRSLEAGFDGHLVKPVDLASLPGYLLEQIDKKKLGISAEQATRN